MDNTVSVNTPVWARGFAFYIYSALLGIFGALGFYCMAWQLAMSMFHESAQHPYMNPFSISAGLLSLLICIAIFVFYLFCLQELRKKIHILFHFITLVLSFGLGIGMWEALHSVVSAFIALHQ